MFMQVRRWEMSKINGMDNWRIVWITESVVYENSYGLSLLNIAELNPESNNR